MLKIATGILHADGTETRGKVKQFSSLKALCDALNAGSAPYPGKQVHGERPYWSPFAEARRKGSAPDWTCLVLDFDHGNPPPNLDGLEQIRYQTPSSTPEAPRWRVIVAVDEPIEFKAVGALRGLYPGADPAAVKPTQIFYHRRPGCPAEYRAGAKLGWRSVVQDLPVSTNNEQPAKVDAQPTMPREALHDALYALDPDMGYDDWAKVGMALHHEYGGSDEGFRAWQRWSAEGQKYLGPVDMASHWRSFKPGGGITGLTLLQMQSAKIDDFPVVAPEQPRIRVIPAREFVYRSRPPWLIKGLLGGELGVVYGESTAGKTFLAVDIAMSVARGIAWRGHRVSPGRVIWIAAEDAYGVQQRQIAYCKHFNCEPGINAIDARVLLTKAEDVRDLIEAIGSATLIVVDTLARVNGGDENDASEMSVLVRNCQALHRATGAFVLLIHHSGWNNTHLRGSSALRAAVDAEIRVAVHETGERQAQATKVKGGPSGRVYGFKLERVDLGLDADGDMESSCIVEPVDTVRVPVERMGRNQQVAFTVLQDHSGEPFEDVVGHVAEQGPMRRDKARNALRDLANKGLAKFAGDKAYLATDVAADFETLMGNSND